MDEGLDFIQMIASEVKEAVQHLFPELFTPIKTKFLVTTTKRIVEATQGPSMGNAYGLRCQDFFSCHPSHFER